MAAAALALLSRYWKPLALAAALAAAIAYRAILVHERDAARAAASAATTQLAQYRSAESACETAVARQNAAVAALKADAAREAAAAQTRAENLATAAAASAARENAAARALQGATVAPGCDGAIAWANREAAQLGKW
jgi:hypothetical protein